MQDGQPRVADVFLRHKDGQRVPVRVRAIPIRDPNGAIIGAAEVFDERVLLPETEDHAHSRAVHDSVDPLTGIPDQESARRHLEGWLLDSADSHIPFGLLMIAIDGLAEFRKSHGAKAAEAVIRVAARTLSGNLRPSDMSGRWSEDRLVAILADCPAQALPKIAGMLQRILSGAAISWWGDRVSATASIGATAVEEGDTAESILGRSEQALAASLSEGGNRVTAI
jgi:diguanylate cyclase (GGDEF)-like protein